MEPLESTQQSLPRWKKRHLENREKVLQIAKNSRLKSTYGITLDDYYDMLNEQCYCCKICGVVFNPLLVKNVCVDHDHNTGAVRGILCGRCNKSLGLLDESIDSMKAMVEYVKS